MPRQAVSFPLVPRPGNTIRIAPERIWPIVVYLVVIRSSWSTAIGWRRTAYWLAEPTGRSVTSAGSTPSTGRVAASTLVNAPGSGSAGSAGPSARNENPVSVAPRGRSNA